MPIPNFDELGLLPEGVWDCDLSEVGARFCWNAHRAAIWAGLTSFLGTEVKPLGVGGALWIDGSFVRSKDAPSDVDIVFEVAHDDIEAVKHVIGFRLRHAELKAAYKVDVWLRHPIVPNDFTSYFQYAGDKCGVELRIDPKHPKGILRVAL